MYVVPADTATGSAKVRVCQPLLASPTNVPWATSWPAVVQSAPVWVPVLLGPL